MTFAYTLIERYSIFGDKSVAYGTFTNGASDSGGDVKTGLKIVEMFVLTVKATTSAATAPVVNETFPLKGGDVTIVSAADQDGFWFAIGY